MVVVGQYKMLKYDKCNMEKNLIIWQIYKLYQDLLYVCFSQLSCKVGCFKLNLNKNFAISDVEFFFARNERKK